ncbi:MAG: site-2 protease family protein [Actinomycetota bacterium]
MNQSLPDAILGLVVLLASVVIHENAHGVAALALGDPTAQKAKRLTLNPIRHLDIVGSLILPAMMFFSTGSMFGYAKPVPVNPRNLKGTDRWGFALVAAAGPLSNMFLAFIAAALLDPNRVFDPSIGTKILIFALEWNLLLAAFNLLPIPPLDGSRFMRVFLSAQGRQRLDRIEPYGFLILLGLIVFLQAPLFRVVDLIRSGLIRLLPI